MIIIIQKIYSVNYIKVTKKKDLFLFFGDNFQNLVKIVIFKSRTFIFGCLQRQPMTILLFCGLIISPNVDSDWLAL